METEHRPHEDANILPLELWSETFVYAEPGDVLSLGKTCHALHAVVSNKSIWIKLLHIVCQKHDLSEPSYPVLEMSVPQLQRAAMGPHLFKRLILNRSKAVRQIEEAQELIPKTIVPLDNALTVPEGQNRGMREEHYRQLVPGGRFMIQATKGLWSSDRSSFVVGLWDLGMPGVKPLASPVFVANTQFQELTKFTVSSLVADPAGQSLRVAVLLINSGGAGRVLKVFQITLSTFQSQFTELGTIQISDGENGGVNVVADKDPILRGDLLLVRVCQAFVFWNFVSARYTVVSADLGQDNRYYYPSEKSLFTGDMLLVVSTAEDRVGVHVWNTPGRESFKRLGKSPIEVTEATCTPSDTFLPFPYNSHTQMQIHGEQTGLPFHFDILSSSRPKATARALRITPNMKNAVTTTGTRYIVDYNSSTDSQQGDGPLAIKRGVSFSIVSYARCYHNSFFAPSLSNSSLALGVMSTSIPDAQTGHYAYFLTPGQDVARTAGGEGSSTVPSSAISVTRLPEAQPNPGEGGKWSVCPSSGRFLEVFGRNDAAVLHDYLW
ncbi:hypothetical protein D9611_005156 [Ephemerocybe angulata]|uniref:F-box domain-containing protein n=1 Tax=Ephemerocybe angulata TaxID=980116 RepID=A0A8H5C058_9AGAR|nr:hypothetical protein D9611_005156 [Tulosesus angulatus]